MKEDFCKIKIHSLPSVAEYGKIRQNLSELGKIWGWGDLNPKNISMTLLLQVGVKRKNMCYNRNYTCVMEYDKHKRDVLYPCR